MDISVIITTHNHCEDLLEPCIESIIRYTNLDNIEIIVVANGCKDNTREYLESLGKPFKLISFDDKLGYSVSANEGIRVATGDYIILMHDDTILLEQAKDIWIHLLIDPFIKDNNVGMTGPIKFIWECGNTQRKGISFWCAAIKREVFDNIGLLDEVFSPGAGEDFDFAVRVENANYKLLQVPIDECFEIGKGSEVSDHVFPIYHKGNGTFHLTDDIIDRNNKILEDRYANEIELVYYDMYNNWDTDINKLFPILRKYAQKCRHITEMGSRHFCSAWAFCVTRPEKIICYDIYVSPYLGYIAEATKRNNINFNFINQDVLTSDIEETDLLFIDTIHTYKQLSQELKLHSKKVRKFIIIHDTATYGEIGEDNNSPAENKAIEEFLSANPEWRFKEKVDYSNGLIILEKINISIVIPTFNHLEDALQPCIDRVLKYTNLDNKEIIIVANGCTDDTKEYIKVLIERVKNIWIKMIWIDQPSGYVIPINTGIKESVGEYIITLDNDSHLLPQRKNEWIDLLLEPFIDNKVGMSGPFFGRYDDIDETVLHSGCAMYRRVVLEEMNYFDDIFGYGYFSDTDLSLRITKGGYRCIPVPDLPENYNESTGTFLILFPVYHPAKTTTMDKVKNIDIINRNKEILYGRHGKKKINMETKIKFSIVIPTYNHCNDFLKPCIESIVKNTDLDEVEIIIVANGCRDNTKEYLDSLKNDHIKYLWFDEPMGYTKSTNSGIKISIGDYIVLLNNDTTILDYAPKNTWLGMLYKPFSQDNTVGITGPLKSNCWHIERKFLIFFCVMISRSVFDVIGLLDEIFNPGGGEDSDLCIKAENAGYKVLQVPDEEPLVDGGGYGICHFPIYHLAEGTMHDPNCMENWETIFSKNTQILIARYGKNVKLNLGSAGLNFPGYISVDKYDQRANLVYDVFDIDKICYENSVEEILASHLIEHINPYHVMKFLNICFKILKPGGKLIIETPNVEVLFERFAKANMGQKYDILNGIFCPMNTTDKGGQEDITSPHLWGWFPQILQEHLVAAGFKTINNVPPVIQPFDYDFRLEAIK